MERTRACDIAIIGGGIMGTSLAWHLARRGAGRVTLLERRTVAAGASGRTGAILRQHYTNQPEAMLAHQSLNFFRHWGDIVGGDCGFGGCGVAVPLPADPHAAENVARLHRNVAMQRAIGIDTRAVTPAELADLQPDARTDDIAAAAWEPSSGVVDAVAATRAMAQAAQRAGAEIREGCPAVTIALDGDRIAGVRTPAGLLRAERVVCAAGPWSPALLRPAGVAVPITTLRVQVVVLARPLAMQPTHAAYIDLAAGMFCRPFGPGRTLSGVSGGDQHDPTDPERYDERADPATADRVRAALARRFPAMAGASFIHGHAGLYDVTPDAHPILDQVGPAGLFLMAGFSGAGFKKGPAVGEAMAGLILEGRSPLVDLTPFRLDRFASDSWRQPWSETEYIMSADFGHKL